jgi:hypothetical protein
VSAARLDAIREQALLHGLVIGLASALELGRHLDERLHSAIASFDACYQFRAGEAARQLVFSDGRVRTFRGRCESPDFEVTFLELACSLDRLRGGPQHVFRLLLENKIDQRGNKHYLFRLGYLIGLCDTRARAVAARLQRSVERVRHAA